MNHELAYDNAILRFLNKVTDLVVLNLLFLVTSIPIFTIGASLTAMHAVNLRSIRYGDGYVIRQYFKAWKENFLQATISWLIFLAAGLVLCIDYRFWTVSKVGTLGRVEQVVLIAIAIFFWMLATWLFPLLAKMRGSLKEQFQNALRMSVAYLLPYTICTMGIAGGAAYAAIRNVGALIILLVLGFSLVSYLQSFFFYRVFAKHIDEDPVGECDPLYGYGAEPKKTDSGDNIRRKGTAE